MKKMATLNDLINFGEEYTDCLGLKYTWEGIRDCFEELLYEPARREGDEILMQLVGTEEFSPTFGIITE